MEYIGLVDLEKHFTFNFETEHANLMYFINDNIYHIKTSLSYYFDNFPLSSFSLSAEHYIDTYFYLRVVPSHLNSEDAKIYDYLLLNDFLYNVHVFILNSLSRTPDLERYIGSFSSNPIHIINRSRHILSTLGYEFYTNSIKEIPFIKIIKTNVPAEKIAKEFKDKEIALNLIKFNVFNITDDEKKTIIHNLYTYFEVHKNEFGSVAREISLLVNYMIKHPLRIKRNSKLDKLIEDTPNIFDKIYNLMIQGFYHMINKSFIDEIDKAVLDDKN